MTVVFPGGPAAHSGSARLSVTGVLDHDILEALTAMAMVALRRGCAELVVDLAGLTDFPIALFAELNALGRNARGYPGRIELVGLDEAVAVVCRKPG